MVKQVSRQFVFFSVPMAIAMTMLLAFQPARAAVLTNRSVKVSNSNVSAVTDHSFTFNVISTEAVGSILFEYCLSPLASRPCDAPEGLSVSDASLEVQSGITGFSIHSSTNTNRIVLTRAPEIVTPGTAHFLFSNVTNHNFAGTVFVRISLLAADDGNGTAIDSGTVAFSTARALTTTAYVPPILIFCAGITVSIDCSSTQGSFLDLGEFDHREPASGTSQYSGATNDSGGYRVAMYGTTLTSGNNTIPALVTATESRPGDGQFGINLQDNSNPDVGINIIGPGLAVPTSGYGSKDMFKFVSGDTISQALAGSNYDRFTVSYMVNISDDQPAGVYAATLTYIATATF